MSNVPINLSPGWGAEPEDAILTAHAAITKGDVVAVAMATVDSTSFQWTTTAAPAALATSATDVATYPFFCVALENVATGAKGRLRPRGDLDGLCGGASSDERTATLHSSTQLIAPAVLESQQRASTSPRKRNT